MKLQRQVAYKYKDKIHYKYVIIVPQNLVNNLGWEAGQELKLEIRDTKLVIALKK